MIISKAAFVLGFVDDYDGSSITNQKYQFWIRGQPYVPIRKKGGYYVFLEPMGEEEEISIQCPDYYPRCITVRKSSLDPREPVFSVRMYEKPGRNYRRDRTSLTGTLESKAGGVAVCAVSDRESGLTTKEIHPEETQTILVMNGFTRENMTGKTYAVFADSELLQFVVISKKGINEYLIEGDISGAPPGLPVRRVYRSVTDEHGNYAIPVSSEEDLDTMTIIWYWHESDSSHRIVTEKITHK